MLKKSVYIRVDDAIILSKPDDTYMTVFDPDKQLLEFIQILASGEGLYVWKS